MNPPLPPNEAQRLEELRRYDILDTPPEPAFDRITHLAARLFDVPIVLVSLIDADRQWFKSCFGLDLRETPRDIAFCSYALLGDDVLVVPDATQDARFADNPAVTGELHIRFYAGAPLVTPQGLNLGTLCLIDTKPRQFDEAQRAMLTDLAATVADEMELRRALETARVEVAERRRAEIALAASETHFRALIENARDIITVLTSDGVICYQSPAIHRVLGYTPEELIGCNAFDFVHPDDLPLALQSFNQVASGAAPSAIVMFRFRHKDGSWRWLEAVGSSQAEYSGIECPSQNGESATVGLVINSRDVTERNHMGNALRDSEARKAAILENALDAIISMDADSRVLEWNPAAERIFGYTREDALGRNMADLIVPVSQRAVHHESVATRLRFDVGPILNRRVELTAIRADGQEIWVELVAMRLPISGPPVFTGFVRDITETKRIESRLRLLESAVVNANDAILITEAEPIDEPGPRILYANEAFTRASGYTLEEVIGKNPRILQGPLTDRAALDKIRAALKRWKPVEVEVINYRKDGTTYWVELSIVPIADETGWFTHWVAIERDVTERKKIQEQLQVAKESAEFANFAKTEFLSRMSHELRTPLNSIIGFSQLMQEEELSSDHAEIIADIHDAGQHLLRLINEVLDISRIESGYLALTLEAVAVNELALDAQKLIAPLAAQRQIMICSEFPSTREYSVLADRQRLSQCLLNLLSNAVKYNRPQGRIEVNCDECKDREKLRFTIRDNGIGIAPENLERLFEPFDRLGADRTAIEGTGLGLALTKRLIDAMGGTLGVESTLGAGSAFWFELPLAES